MLLAEEESGSVFWCLYCRQYGRNTFTQKRKEKLAGSRIEQGLINKNKLKKLYKLFKIKKNIDFIIVKSYYHIKKTFTQTHPIFFKQL